MPGAGRAGGGVGACGRARTAAQHGGNAAGQRLLHLLRADEVDVGIHAPGCEQAAFAGNDLRAGADDHVHVRLHVRVAGLAHAGYAPVPNAQIGLDDAERRIQNNGVGDDRVHGAFGIAALALPHAVADDLAPAKADFFAGHGVVALHLNPEVRIRQADAVARGGAVQLDVLASWYADHASSSPTTTSSGPITCPRKP